MIVKKKRRCGKNYIKFSATFKIQIMKREMGDMGYLVIRKKRDELIVRVLV